MNVNDLSYKVRGIIYLVYKELGPGLLESTYCSALAFELQMAGFQVRTQVPLPVNYKNTRLDVGYRIDLLVNDQLIIEVKSVEAIAEVHHKQIITYLKHSGIQVGLLVNFNTANIMDSIFRKVNGDVGLAKKDN